MVIPAVITGAIIDIAKKELIAIGKKVAHQLIDSVTGTKLGEIICYRRKERNNNLLLFVHGFSGNSADTFGATPDMLVANSEFDGWDVFSIGYSSDIFPSIGKGLWSVNPDITKISLYLTTILKIQFSDYSRIAFVAHSMGGLAVQRTILDAEKELSEKISHVILFGTPSAGLKKAFWLRFWNKQIRDLNNESVFVTTLRNDWNTKFKSEMNFSFRTIAGSKDEFVPVDSSLLPFDKKYHGVIEGNHINMVKPKDGDDNEHQSFQVILKTLLEEHFEYIDTNSEDLNILLGEYHAIINKYLDIAKDIALKPLANLVFALECTGRNAEALKVLMEHPLAGKDSDTLGIIGGRHKRNYLFSGLQKDLDQAIDYYSKALALSEANQNNKQIFYHAINLAFLAIVAGNDEQLMKKYAQQALNNCISPQKDMWELATLAEANLYLGNLELAKEFYKQTAIMASNDIRGKQSVYRNAFYGYQSLMATQAKDAEFLKLLEELFL